MKDYILVVDLPDRKACNYCHALDCFEDGTGRCPSLNREIVLDGITWNRPTDCPLIPVDRVIGRIRSMQGERKASGLDHWNDALDDALEILRIELGVTE